MDKFCHYNHAVCPAPQQEVFDWQSSSLETIVVLCINVLVQVMTVVKGLTKTGITICATIHNPTPYCFNLFDRLMILLHGRVVYSGENGDSRLLTSPSHSSNPKAVTNIRQCSSISRFLGGIHSVIA
jgi:ABC-type lipopolysaccharide export system ATPase subunit